MSALCNWIKTQKVSYSPCYKSDKPCIPIHLCYALCTVFCHGKVYTFQCLAEEYTGIGTLQRIMEVTVDAYMHIVNNFTHKNTTSRISAFLFHIFFFKCLLYYLIY